MTKRLWMGSVWSCSPIPCL